MAGLHLRAVGALHLLQRSVKLQSQQVIRLTPTAGTNGLVTLPLLGILRTLPLVLRLLLRLETILQGEEVPILDAQVESDAGETFQLRFVHHAITRIHAFEEMRQEIQPLGVVHRLVPHDGQTNIHIALTLGKPFHRLVPVETLERSPKVPTIIPVMVLRLPEVVLNALHLHILVIGVILQGYHIRKKPDRILIK